jgi:hypothetical protein
MVAADMPVVAVAVTRALPAVAVTHAPPAVVARVTSAVERQ